MIALYDEEERKEMVISELWHHAEMTLRAATRLGVKSVTIYVEAATMPRDDYRSVRIGDERRYVSIGSGSWKEETLG